MATDAHKLQFKKLIASVTISLLTLLYLYILYFSISNGLEVYTFGFFLSIPFLSLIVKYPKLWIFSVLVLFIPILIVRDVGVSVFEVLFSVVSLGGLLYFFFCKLVIEKKTIIHNYGDLFILSFFILIPFNIFFAAANNVEILRWFREIFVIMLILYYFPIREYFKTEKEFKLLLAITAILSAITIIISLLIFRERVLQEAVYVLEVVKSKLPNQTLFTATIFTSIVLFLYQKKTSIRFCLLILAGIATLALVVTYTRTNWIIVVVEIFALFFLIQKKERLSLLVVLFFASSLITFTSLVIFKDNAKLFFRILEARLESSSQMREDKSIASRLAEYPTVFRGIKENPLWGNGFAKKIKFLDPIHVRNLEGEIIHNGYAFFIYRGGIPMALLYFAFFFYYTFKSLSLTFKASEPFAKSLALSSLLIFVSLIFANLTGPQFIHREGIFTILITIPMVEFASSNRNGNQIPKIR